MASIKHAGRISVIVSTWNCSEHLRKCVSSLEMQTLRPHEVVIADDGSDAEHVARIQQIIRDSSLNITHVRQERDVSRRSANRNNGVRHSKGDALCFIDGDLVIFPDVLARLIGTAGPKHWVTGNAVRLTRDQTSLVSEDIIRSGGLETIWSRLDKSQIVELRRAAIHFRKRSFLSALWPSEARLKRIRLASGVCLMPRSLFEAVNGFDEAYEGWGYEDRDLGLRLQLAGFRGRNIADTTRVLHLHHEKEQEFSDKSRRESLNRAHFHRARNGSFRCKNGLIHEST
jgi:glycosyltransferase involved in cell wall biosynthesis